MCLQTLQNQTLLIPGLVVAVVMAIIVWNMYLDGITGDSESSHSMWRTLGVYRGYRSWYPETTEQDCTFPRSHRMTQVMLASMTLVTISSRLFKTNKTVPRSCLVWGMGQVALSDNFTEPWAISWPQRMCIIIRVFITGCGSKAMGCGRNHS